MLVTMPGGYNSGRPYVLMTNEKVPSRPPINPLTHPHNLQGGHIVYFRTYLALRLLCIARKVLCFALLVHWGMKLKEWLHLAGKLPAAADPEQRFIFRDTGIDHQVPCTETNKPQTTNPLDGA